MTYSANQYRDMHSHSHGIARPSADYLSIVGMSQPQLSTTIRIDGVRSMDTCNQLYGQMRILADFDIHAALPILLGIFLLFVCIDLLPPSPLLLLVNPALPLFDYYVPHTWSLVDATTARPIQNQDQDQKRGTTAAASAATVTATITPRGRTQSSIPTWPCLLQIAASIVRIDSSRHQHPRLPSTHTHCALSPDNSPIGPWDSCLFMFVHFVPITPYSVHTYSSKYHLVGMIW